jgi:TetR/AcrR family transcriptional regulator, transcriptional repressor of bet genes
VPKKVDHAQRREELAALVVRVVEAEGAEAATFRRVAEAGRFSYGVLTHYFEDKDAMIAAAFAWLARQSFASLNRRLKETPSGRARLVAALAFMVPARGEASYPGVWLALWSAAQHNTTLARVHRDYYRRWRSLVTQSVSEMGREVGVGSKRPLADVVDLLIAGIDGLWLGVVTDAKRFPPRRRARLVNVLVNSVIGPEAGRFAPNTATSCR